MAGRGPAPKDPDQRARTNAPERGDWHSLPALKKPVLPTLPRRSRGEGTWSTRTRRTWTAWRCDWVTGAYGPAEIAMVVELAHLYEDAVRAGGPAAWAEVRQWMDRLGLTMKGKRDLRLRPAEAPAAAVEAVESPFVGMRLVADAD